MRFRFLYEILLSSLLFAGYNKCTAQGTCPVNMGFENGSFQNWECFSGSISQTGVINVSPTAPLGSIHTINDITVPPTGMDPYGNFPVNCPNGGRYSIKLGNEMNGAQAERVSYTFTVPPNQNDYSIIYNYAVVFQNPSHQGYQQPKFTSQVFDVTANQYIDCGSFEFVASSGLSGFQLSPLGQTVYYKPWSPITINLNGYAGKTIRLEFTNNDCTLGGHFGYAYLDVDENCSTPISGNIYCGSLDTVRLKAPSGFQKYNWYNATFTQLLGTSNTLLVTPPPPPNTSYALEIIPYPNLGCQDTLYTTVNLSPEVFVFKVLDTIQACPSATVNLTAPGVTAGSTPGLTFTYYTDAGANNYLVNPYAVSASGTYYIKGASSSGCGDIKAVRVIIRAAPNLVITDPPQACAPAKVNLTAAAITAASDADLSYTYWQNAGATIPLLNPGSVDLTGTYYIKGSNPIGCYIVKPVNASIADMAINNATACGVVDITLPAITAGSSAGLTYSYWTDAAATQSLSSAQQVTNTGAYYIKGTNAAGCSIIKPVQVKINPFPVLAITDPSPVVFPATIDVTNTFPPTAAVAYSYWKNQLATNALARPVAVGTSGTYYIMGTTQAGCSAIKPVVVVIKPPPLPKLIAPNAFSPNNDGINDVFKPVIEGEVILYHLKIYNRAGQEIFDTPSITRYWDGTLNGKPLPVATYYWVFNGTDTYRGTKVAQSGAVTLLR